ncbi:NAD-dependent epimerase/dehydratase family protein [Mycolicibacterium sp. P9-64]|uniref:NAD-dependent epimerase/dehydratase family protein n=1 Tax=Mycolicibacterium sp. P9-64 TaxID=2024612 RepID=UPI0011EF6A4C|nr:NAD-dependent epimerase/dehydratase family protein [Mycolicibacterium sp. P9-64]KAA0079109.1 NAD-dependent epimerase/dehydratase family protein [Mycolicibacterium sp. P9-64]
MTVLVTGVAGFIGSTLAERLVSDGHEVIGIDNFSDYYDREIKESNISRLADVSDFTLLEGDLNKADLPALLDRVEIVYHQAGQPGVRKSWGTDFADYVDANVCATQRLLEAVRRSAPGLTRFVYASSSSVYGDAERYPTLESDRPQPRSPYGVTKLAAEHLVNLYAANFGIPAISLRYFTVYGPKQRPDMAFNRFIALARRGRPLPVHGDGSQIREFTYVDDIVEANVRAGDASVAPGTVVNLSGGASTSVNDVLELLEKIHGEPLQLDRGEPALGDVFRTGGSTERATALLGWEPRVGIEDGLAREYDWLAAKDE